MAEKMDGEREAFEWFLAEQMNDPDPWKGSNGQYRDPETRACWATWQAARAHITQPAQAVDVGAIPDAKPLPDLRMASYHEAVGWNACREALLTRALGNAQAEGWKVPDADAQWALRFKAAVNVLESDEDQPAAAACGLLLIDSCMGKNAAKVTLNFDGIEHKDGSDLGDWTVTVERKRKASTTPPSPEE